MRTSFSGIAQFFSVERHLLDSPLLKEIFSPARQMGEAILGIGNRWNLRGIKITARERSSRRV